MFREFDEGPSSRVNVGRERTGRGLTDQFESLERHGTEISGTAGTIQELLDRLQNNAFVTDCEALLASLNRK